MRKTKTVWAIAPPDHVQDAAGLGKTRTKEVLTPAALDSMRWGTYGRWRRVEVIGFHGLAVMFGYKKRDGSPAWETVRTQHSTVPGFPSPRFTVVWHGRGHYLFDADELRRWGRQTGRLNPDGTPRRLRPVRGKTKPRTTT